MSAIRPGYKQTEVGVIPEAWEVTPIIAAADFLNNRRRPVKDADRAKMKGEYPYYGAAGIVDYVNDFIFDDELVLIGEDGENILSRNLPVAFRISGKAWVNNHAHVLKPKAHVDTAYFALACAELDLAAHNSGTAQPKITKGTCERLVIALPPLPEQQAIAEALGDADGLIEALEALIAKKRDIKQGAMQDLLTGHRRLPGFQGEWEVKRLSECASFFKGKGLPKSVISTTGAFPCIHYGELFTFYGMTIKEVASRTNACTDVFFSRADDVLMPTSDVTPRGLAKASCLLLGDVVLGGDMLVIRPDPSHLVGSFLAGQVRYRDEQVLKLVTGSTVFHLYASDMKKFEFPLPALDEQRVIAAVLCDMDAEIAALEDKLAKARAVKQGMMQVLLTGEIRLL